jgi:hypothetical protein
MLEGIAGSVTGAYQQTLTAKAPQPNRVAARPQELEGEGAGAAKATGETAAGGAAGTTKKVEFTGYLSNSTAPEIR